MTAEKSAGATSEASEVTLRDTFAIAALQGILATYRNGGMPKGGPIIVALGAYLIAEAMLEARTAKRKD
jgi:hypothetical protein